MGVSKGSIVYGEEKLIEMKEEFDLLYSLCRKRMAKVGSDKSSYVYTKQMAAVARRISASATNLIINGLVEVSDEMSKLFVKQTDSAIIDMAETSVVIAKNSEHIKIIDEAKNALWRFMSAFEMRGKGVSFDSKYKAIKHISRYNKVWY